MSGALRPAVSAGGRPFHLVLLGADIGIYALARAFHEEYAAVSTVVSLSALGPVADSTILRNVVLGADAGPEQILQALDSLAGELAVGPDAPQLLLVANTDWLVRFLVENRDALEQRYTVPFLDRALLARLADKAQFAELCTELGIPTPRTVVQDFAEAGAGRWQPVPVDLDFPLIAKAAGGSVRDALSVLGQLIAGSADDGLTADYVASGLGLTDAVLLDRVVAAIASRDGAGAFAAVDAVVESGHDGRRFLTDLLERLRDLILLHYVPPEQHGGLLQLPPDQIEAMRAQGALFGSAELSRAADLVSVGLSELKGATAPRLQLGLLLARLLLPGADDAAEGHGARLDRLEREVGAAAVHGPSAPAAAPAPPAPTHAAPTGPDAGRGAPDGQRTGGQSAGSQSTAAPAPASGGSAAARSAGQRRQQPGSRAAASATPPPRLSDLAPATGPSSGPQAAPDQQAPQDQPPAPAPDPQAARASAADAAQRPAGQAGGTAAGGQAPSASAGGTAGAGGQAPSPRAAGPELSLIRDNWPAVMTELGRRSRVAWTLWDSSQPVAADDRELTVAVADQGRLTSIRSSNRSELLRQVIIDVLRLDLKVNPVLVPAGPAADADAGSASPDDPDLGDADVSGVDLVIRELGAVPIGEIGEQ